MRDWHPSDLITVLVILALILAILWFLGIHVTVS